MESFIGALPSLPLAVMCLHRAAVWLAGRRCGGGGFAGEPLGRERTRLELAESLGAERLPPVTWMRPIKPGVPDLAAKLERFLASVRPGDEVIFGVEAGSEEAKLCAGFAGEHGWVKVVDGRGAALNPKVARLLAMTPHARHEHWILADAEALIDAEFADAFRREWSRSGADVLTAGYHFTGMKTWPQWLDAMSIIQTLWPGLELVRAFGRVRFTLGACTAVRRGDVEAIGGWAALADVLAEDQRLGALLAAKGKAVRISEVVLSLEADPLGWRDYWRHQRRVAVTYRAATPAGAFGMIATRGFPLCLGMAAIFPGGLTLMCLAAAAVLHLACVAMQARRLGVKLGARLGLSLIAELVETACWALSWFSMRVWWGGKWRRLTRHGQLLD